MGGSETILYDTVIMGTCHYASVKAHRSVEHKVYNRNDTSWFKEVNQGPSLMIMYDAHNKCATGKRDVHHGENGGLMLGKRGLGVDEGPCTTYSTFL